MSGANLNDTLIRDAQLAGHVHDMLSTLSAHCPDVRYDELRYTFDIGMDIDM